MRIVMSTSATLVNGVAVHVLSLSKYLLSRGHDILLVHRPKAWLLEQPGLEQAQKLETPFSKHPRELIRVGERVLDFAPDVVHTHMGSAHAYGAVGRLFTPVPVVATAHVPRFQLHWPMNHLVIATSQDVADHNIRYNRVAPRKIRVIPNFIDTGAITPPDADERKAVRAALGLADDAFVVGSVGHLANYKRPADLVRGFSHLARVEPKARLVLIGAMTDREANDETRAAIATAGLGDKVMLLGARNDALRLLAAFDVFALTSGRETGPIAAIEAMARGLPLVATPVGVVPDLVTEGRNGYMVPVGDTVLLGRRLVALASDRARLAAFAAAARAPVMEKFSVERVAPRIEAVLAEAAQIKHKPLFGAAARLLMKKRD